MVIQPDFAHRLYGRVGKQWAHRRQLGAPVPVVYGHGGGVLLDQTFGVDAQRGVDKGIFVRQRQHPGSIAGMGRALQNPCHAAQRQGGQHSGAVGVELVGGIVGVCVKNVVHTFVFSCGARFTR